MLTKLVNVNKLNRTVNVTFLFLFILYVYMYSVNTLYIGFIASVSGV